MTGDRFYKTPCAKRLDCKANLLQSDCVLVLQDLSSDAQEDGPISSLECLGDFECGKALRCKAEQRMLSAT